MLNNGNILGLHPFRAFHHIKFHHLPLDKRAMPLAADCPEMDKDILALFWDDKAETLSVVKSFHRTTLTIFHVFLLKNRWIR